MLEAVEFGKRFAGSAAYAVLIPSWNNLPYLQLCIRSLELHSKEAGQIIVIINEGRDGSLEWIRTQEAIDYVYSPVNLGICYALNVARSLIAAPYVVYMNDDMYALPGWDKALLQRAQAMPNRMFMLSGTMIEPYRSLNSCISFGAYGEDVAGFAERPLLEHYAEHKMPDWSGSTWPPNLLPIELWDAVGGLSILFSPGSYSDPDLSRKLWELGVRHFVGVGDALVYHFGKKSTGRLRRHRGRELFLHSWGISSGTFTKYYLKLGQPYTGQLSEPEVPFWRKLKDWLKYKGLLKA